MYKQFEFTKKIKSVLLSVGLVGLLATTAGILLDLDNGHRIWANVLLNSFYFLAIGLGAAFFVVVHILGESGWQTSIQRIPEAMGMFTPIGSLLMLVVLLGLHDIYHWTHTDQLDEILLAKRGYLNTPFFIVRTLVYLVGWTWLIWKIRQLSLASDQNDSLKLFNKSRTLAGIFIVFFAITSSTSAWDWIMSIDSHWFSTLFGWYIFIGFFVSSVAVIIFLVVVLRKMGYLEHVNDEHLHDLGKYLFGFSIFWAYLWISQYLLIWYSNIPEETVYFVTRQQEFGTLFWTNVLVNFAVPFLYLMPRGTKRQFNWLLPVSIIVFVGHWLDLYLAIMPGAVGSEQAHIGVLEIGMTLLYLSLFFWVTFRQLAKAPMVPENHPYFKESFEYDNIR
jgi:hypothetical protein